MTHQIKSLSKPLSLWRLVLLFVFVVLFSLGTPWLGSRTDASLESPQPVAYESRNALTALTTDALSQPEDFSIFGSPLSTSAMPRYNSAMLAQNGPKHGVIR